VNLHGLTVLALASVLGALRKPMDSRSILNKLRGASGGLTTWPRS
jgi:hypothetical protein